jgi:guanine deaminase
MKINIYRAAILFFTKDPSKVEDITQAIKYYENGLLIVENGYIKAVGEYKEILNQFDLQKEDINQSYINKLIMPGFIDTHVHYPQTEMIGSFGEELLPWLNKYTFPTEIKFKDKEYSKSIAEFFINELFKNGTTTAMVYATVFEESVDAIFEAAEKKNMRLITGKVMMDRNAPSELMDTAQSSYEQSEKLIKKWHEKDRLLYAITPRFAPTSTPEQLVLAGKLKEKYPTTYVQTHLSENQNEILWVKSLFPEADNYLDVYLKVGLVKKKSVFAHAIYLENDEYEMLNKNKASVSFCPTSNLFLGSGLFKIREMKKENYDIKIGLGTDVGAGTSFSMLKTLNEAYKVVSLEQNNKNPRLPLSSFEAFYQITLGAAQSLHLEDKIGKLENGYEADFIVIDFEPDPLQKLRMANLKANKDNTYELLSEKLFALMMMGDDRNIFATYVNGEKVY